MIVVVAMPFNLLEFKIGARNGRVFGIESRSDWH